MKGSFLALSIAVGTVGGYTAMTDFLLVPDFFVHGIPCRCGGGRATRGESNLESSASDSDHRRGKVEESLGTDG
ncbi:MAG: hypothetical protein DRP71_10435 [Verrucomicrobia bacterium]|nr:MAG: hypothetical protein DRP71_10435 [Verrucomicrobiota bacterium]